MASSTSEKSTSVLLFAYNSFRHMGFKWPTFIRKTAGRDKTVRLKLSRSSEHHEGARCSRQLDDPAALPTGKELTLTTECDTLWVPGPVQAFWARGTLLALSKTDPQFLDFSIHSLVNIPNELSALKEGKHRKDCKI